MWLRFIAFPLAVLAGLVVAGILLLGLVVALAFPNLPSLQSLTEYKPKVPLRIYTADGVIIGEFGEERRAVVSIEEVPAQLKNAILAAEDERFYQHAGIDYIGVVRAAYANLISGGRRQGASTITMQVARNFFLSSEKTLNRKLYEAMLAFKIEHSLSKDQILELYINQIYLGQRAYGFGAASQIYFGKALGELNTAEIAMLAGLPKAPSLYNPVANPQRAKQRQQYVLRRMKELGHITAEQHDEALKLPLRAKREANEYSLHAEYLAEMVRQALSEHYPDDVYTRGFRVYTTVRKADQEAAYLNLRKAVLEYDRQQGYRGPRATRNCRRPSKTMTSTTCSPTIPTATTCSPQSSSPPTRSMSRRRCAAARKSPSAGRACASRRAPSTRRPRRRSGASGAARSSACNTRASRGASCSCRRSRRRSSRWTRRTAQSTRWSAASTSGATSSIT
jgi:penicillin-binding protein 1A